jgi:deoxycytidylate deaminase/dephospho-CoA kinase
MQGCGDKDQNSENYLKSAIARIYGEDDDLIVFGLTGRTGSGCSTVAKILQSPKNSIRHTLFNGINPETNEDRKQRIIFRHFEATWAPFLLIQVRSIITTFLLDKPATVAKDYFRDILIDPEKSDEFFELLEKLEAKYCLINKEANNAADAVEFYTEYLPQQCDELRSKIGESAFVQLYQRIGKNIRLSGQAYSEKLVEGKFFSLAERIDEIIKAIHEQRQTAGEKTYIVVDAIRNPLEALFFQERYPSFYLVAISTPESDRQARLRKLKYSDPDISSIDANEYTTRDLDDIESYSVQDIQACLQRADLYLSNPNVANVVSEFQSLSNQIIRFVSLIRRPGIVTPSAIERCMQIAYTAKLNSGCISRQVGAVVTDKNYSIRSVGWNDAPHGHVPCNLRSRDDLQKGVDHVAYSEFEKTDANYLAHFASSSERFSAISEQGRNNSFCFKSEYNAFTREKNQVHTRSLHAEENAFLQLAKYGSPGIEGGVLFTTASPCELCSKKAYQLGIKEIYYIDPYPGIAVNHILRGGINNPSLILFSGAIGRAFHKLYSPIMPYKDELNALTA